MSRRLWMALAAIVLVLAPACTDGDTGSQGEDTEDGTLTIYSGREEELVGPIIDRFEESSDRDVEVRYGDTAELAAQIINEGDNSPADVFFAQDAGALGAVAKEQLFAELPDATLDEVPERFRSEDGHWVGTSG